MAIHRVLVLVTVFVLAFSTAAGVLNAATYEQLFDFPDGTDDLGDDSIIFSSTQTDGEPTAQVLNNQLRLTHDGTGSTQADFKIPSLGIEATQSWIASFDFTLSEAEGGNAPADGFSFNYGPIDENARGSEEGFGVGLSIEFDTWNNGDGEAGHNIAVDNVDVPDGFNEEDVMVDGVTRRAVVIWSEGNATVRVDDNVLFQGLPTPGFEPTEDDIFAFAARTGGAWEDLFIDNLVIEAPVPGDPGDFNEDGVIDLADYDILLSNFNQPGGRTEGDTNFSFTVDLADFINFREAINAAPEGGAVASVPEPSTMLLGFLGLAALALQCRRGRESIRG